MKATTVERRLKKMRRCNEKHYVTLKDLYEIQYGDNMDVQLYFGFGPLGTSHIITDLFEIYGESLITAITTHKPFSLDEVNKFLDYTFFPYYLDEVILMFDHKPSVLEMNTAIDKWLKDLVAIFNQTWDRYSTLIDYYTDKNSELLDQIRTTSENRVNDTPQNGGDFSSDTYTSLYNKQSVASDRDTPMERLAQIGREYRNLEQDWLKEFGGLFINSAIPFMEEWDELSNYEYYRQ